MRFPLRNNKWWIAALVMAWAIGLFAVERSRRPVIAPVPPGPSSPTITLWMNHMCCSGCLDELRIALARLDWLGPAELVKEDGAKEPRDPGAGGDYSRRVAIPVRTDRLARIDFIALDRALRDAGFLAERIDFGGVRDLRFQARVLHLCCSMCRIAVEEGLDAARSLRTGGLPWVDRVDVIRREKEGTVTVAAHPVDAVDVAALIAALGHIGFAPVALQVSAGP